MTGRGSAGAPGTGQPGLSDEPSVPYLDLRAQYRSIRDEVAPAVARVLESGQFVLGPEVEAFEREFAAWCGSRDAVAVNSGTSALHLALLACGVGPGDEVITVPFTFVATVAAIEYAGARPVLVDVDPGCGTMSPEALERAITPRTKAIVPVHLFGQPADMAPILDVARRHGVRVIEDAAQAHGAEYRGRRCGAMGDIGCFSFYPGKNLGACGEGGALVTGDPAIAARVRLLRSWGEERRYEHLHKGFNYRMDAIQGAILRVKLRHLDGWTDARRERAGRYGRVLTGTAASPLREAPDRRHVFHIYAVRVPHRDAWRAHLAAHGVQTGVHYPIGVHEQPAYRDLGYRHGDFPASEALADEVLSLPIFPELTDAQMDRVAGLFRAGLPSRDRVGETAGAASR
ncbi:MAG: DegT/DnrJ/EryC1/StrS family aminotransferase [Acidimicrobiia bacterium]|nr:DegT/DnrJ/EryC1/StrS family aminotransferase [Acidimicrobiia bacterium]